jgi:hypothetical protein
MKQDAVEMFAHGNEERICCAKCCPKSREVA